MVEERLPTFERASALIEAYLENLSWMLRPVDREQIWEELIPVVYRKKRVGSEDTSDETIPTDPHILSLMLGVFAIGAFADMTQPPWNEEAELYYHLSRTAISLKPVFEGASLAAVQALATLVMFDVVACRKNSLEDTWKLTSLCLSLAASVRSLLSFLSYLYSTFLIFLITNQIGLRKQSRLLITCLSDINSHDL